MLNAFKYPLSSKLCQQNWWVPINLKTELKWNCILACLQIPVNVIAFIYQFCQISLACKVFMDSNQIKVLHRISSPD